MRLKWKYVEKGEAEDKCQAQYELFCDGLMFPNWGKIKGISKSNG